MNKNYEQYSQTWEEPEDGTTDMDGAQYPSTAQVDALPAVKNSFASPRMIKKLSTRTELSAETARSRAVLARQSLMNLCVLSHAEEILRELVSTGATRFKLIVDAVAMSDARMIALFGGEGK